MENNFYSKHLAHDPVNHPSHYRLKSMETIDLLAEVLSEEELKGYCMGNVLKYLTRYKHKNGLEDLKKAGWYLNRLIGMIEEKKERTDE